MLHFAPVTPLDRATARLGQDGRRVAAEFVLPSRTLRRCWRIVSEPIRPKGDEMHSDPKTRMGSADLADANGSTTNTPPDDLLCIIMHIWPRREANVK